jgi:tetratricopeptide (TPR) repeat protein
LLETTFSNVLKHSKMIYKTIFTGRLEFGSQKSYDKVLKMYHHRVENYYKSDILLTEEEIFDPASTSLNVPRFITQGSVKSWKNTVSLLEYLAQFAISGNLGTWVTEEGNILHQGFVEPKSDKVVVQAFLKGRDLSNQEGKEVEAKEALSQAISKYERHAQAYERRGFVNCILKNYTDAIYDFTKSIDMAPGMPDPYFGRARIKMLKEDYSGAIQDFDNAIKKSIPLQAIYWKSRRLKADCHLKLNDYKGALNDFKFYSARNFKPNDPNKVWQRYTTYHYGRALLETKEYELAIAAFTKAMTIEEGVEATPIGPMHLYRGDSRRKAGKTGYLKDWQAALKLGVKEAKPRIDNR